MFFCSCFFCSLIFLKKTAPYHSVQRLHMPRLILKHRLMSHKHVSIKIIENFFPFLRLYFTLARLTSNPSRKMAFTKNDLELFLLSFSKSWITVIRYHTWLGKKKIIKEVKLKTKESKNKSK